MQFCLTPVAKTFTGFCCSGLIAHRPKSFVEYIFFSLQSKSRHKCKNLRHTGLVHILHIYDHLWVCCKIDSKSLAGCHLHRWDMTSNWTSQNDKPSTAKQSQKRSFNVKPSPSQCMFMFHVSTKINQLAPGVATKASLASASRGKLWALTVRHCSVIVNSGFMIQYDSSSRPWPSQTSASSSGTSLLRHHFWPGETWFAFCKPHNRKLFINRSQSDFISQRLREYLLPQCSIRLL